LESVVEDKPDVIQIQTITRYFETMGFKTGDAQHSNGHATWQVDEICREINNTLNIHEKVYLLLLVADCLLDRSDTPGFDRNLCYIFSVLGVDSSLMMRLKGFLGQHDPMTFDEREYLLLSPQHVIENDMLEGRWIEDNVPHAKAIHGTTALDHFSGHLLVMFIDQIKTYVIRCIYSTDQKFDQDSEHPCRFRLLTPGQELSINFLGVEKQVPPDQ
jgi:hypothetical protein